MNVGMDANAILIHLKSDPKITEREVNLIPAFLYRRIANRPNLVKIVDNIGWLVLDKVLRMGVGLFVGVWIARYLGPQQFGLLSFATAFVGLFGAIAALGLQGPVVRDMVRDPANKEKTLGTAAALMVIASLVSYSLILVTIFWMRPEDPIAKAIVAILGSTVLFKVSEVAVYWFESQVLSKYTVWVQNGVLLVFAVIKVGLILQGADLITFAWAMMAEALAMAVLLLVVLSLRGLQVQKLCVRLDRAKKLLADSWPLLLSAIAIVIYTKIDQIMLGQMIGDEAVGIYSAAAKLSMFWYFLPGIVVASVFPAIIRAKYVSDNLYRARMQNLYDMGVVASLVISGAVSIFASPIVVMLFGVEYAEAGGVLRIHMWALAFVFLGFASNRWLILENLQLLQLERTLLGASFNVLLNLFLIPKMGIHGAAYATVLSVCLVGLFYDVVRNATREMFLMKMKALMLPRSVHRIYRQGAAERSAV